MPIGGVPCKGRLKLTLDDLTTRERRQGIAPPSFGERHDQDQKLQVACAMVRYRARFADNTGTVVFLSDCESPREELDAAELDEVAKLRGQPVSAIATIQQAATELSRQIDGDTKRGAATLTEASNGARSQHGRRCAQRQKFETLDDDLRFAPVRWREPLVKPEVDPSVFIARLWRGQGVSPVCDHVCRIRMGRVAAALTLKIHPVGCPREQEC